MDSPDQRRKRKRFMLKQSSHSLRHLFSVRSLVLCFSFLSFLSLLSYTLPFTSSAFRPVLVVSSLSISSSSSSKSAHGFASFELPLKIESRVLFPDHVLLLVRLDSSSRDKLIGKIGIEDLVCVYYRYYADKDIIGGDDDGVSSVQNVISVDGYNGDLGMIVRCPFPSANYSAVVNLRRRTDGEIVGRNETVASWENVVYAATLDGETAIVFVKGLNLRADRESDPTPFSCHFGLGRGRKSTIMLTTRAVTAAQEVVRCSLPGSMRNNPDKAQGVRVTVGYRPHVHARGDQRVLLPSVAKIFNPVVSGVERKHELCVCTMVWNQAPAMREWVMYHAWLGVERWFIYDNNSDDGLDEVVKELDDENYNVSRHVWPWIKTQEAGFSHCALRAKSECRWVSFMDVDEYFYFPHSTSRNQRLATSDYAGQYALRELVANFSSASTNIAEIRTSCHSFGPSGLNSPPPKGVTVGYTCRLQSPERHKSIIRPDALDTTLLNVVHHFHLRNGFEYLNLPQSIAIINHYKYQVWEVFRAKFYRRVATYVADWQQNQNEGSRDRAPGLGTEAIEPPDWPQKFCEVWDTALRDIVLANLVDNITGLLPWETQHNSLLLS